MDANEFDPVTAFQPPEAIEASEPRRTGVLRSTWIGAKTGFRWVSFVAGPISGIIAIVGLTLTILGAGAGYGWRTYRFLGAAMVLYFGCTIYGIVIGGLVGLIAGLIRKGGDFVLSFGHGARADRKIATSPELTNEVSPPSNDLPARARRIWPWAMGASLAIVAVVTSAAAYATATVSRRLAEAEAAAVRDDPFWRLVDLMARRDPVPDVDNSAIVINQALEVLPEKWPQAEVLTGLDRLVGIEANIQLEDATAGVLRHELETHRDAVVIARTVADYRRGRHELELVQTLFDTPLRETQAARTAVRLLVIDAAVRVQDDDPDGALDSCRAIIGVARSIGDEPFSISQNVRAAFGEHAITTARRVLGQGEPSDAALARLQTLVLDELAQPLLLYGLRGERATQYELIRRVVAGEVPIEALSGDRNGSSTSPVDMGPWGVLMFENQRAVGLEWMNQAVAIARRPFVEQAPLWVSWQAEIQRVKKSRMGVVTLSLPLLMMRHISASVEAQSRYQATLGATAILLAAERHRRKGGNWPASIAAIHPELLPDRPLDPFTGQPFLMERHDGQIVIYSVGPNLKAEHALYDPKRWREGARDDIGTSGWDVPRRRQKAPPQ